MTQLGQEEAALPVLGQPKALSLEKRPPTSSIRFDPNQLPPPHINSY